MATPKPPPALATGPRASLAARLLILPVRLYQKTLSPALPVLFGPYAGCRFSPTCSHYAIEALATHGACRGFLLSLWRIVRCTPLSAGGSDPVPPRRQTPSCLRA
jgi:putative membrane protein insertion efficiency factor